jgi:outer membrane protein TolC
MTPTLLLALALLDAPETTSMPGAGPAPGAALVLATGDAAEAAAPGVRRLSLRELMALAEQNYPELPIVAAERDGALALQSLADWTKWTPKLTLSGLFGVVPAARGDIFSSPDNPRDLSSLGPFYRARVDASLPLYTFGRISLAQDAADALVESKDAKSDAKRKTARSLSARAYFGYLLASGNLDAIAATRKELARVMDKLEHPAEDDPEPDPLDLLKARSYGFQLDRAQAIAERGLAIAESGLRELAGVSVAARVEPAANELKPLAARVPELTQAIEEALAASPEIREAELGARARELYARSSSRQRLPAVSLEGRFEQGQAQNRDKQSNPFVYEPFNVKSLAATLALRWDLNYMQTNARSRKEAADAAELRAKHRALVVRTRVDLSEAHARLVEAETIHETSRGALSTGANWLRIAEENYGLETASMKDLVEAYSAFVQTRSSHLDAIHALNLAVIEWRMALGREPLEEGESP